MTRSILNIRTKNQDIEATGNIFLYVPHARHVKIYPDIVPKYVKNIWICTGRKSSSILKE